MEVSAKKNINLDKLFALATHLSYEREMILGHTIQPEKVNVKKEGKCTIM